LLGIAVLLLLSGLALVTRQRWRDGDEHARIQARYGHLIVPVAARAGGWTQPTELADMDALVRLAEHHGKLILHLDEGLESSYVVEDGATAYRYRVQAREPVAAMVWPAARDLPARP
jgi:hypothetical protein